MDVFRAVMLALLITASACAQSDVCTAVDSRPQASSPPQFFDEPRFTVAGITDNTYRGGHGSDTILRSSEALAKATASLGSTTGNTDAADFHHALAQADERSGNPLQAVHEFQRAAESNPTEPNLFDWGVELLAHRAPQPAAEVFVRGIRLFPQSVRMLLGLATARYSIGQYDGAAQCFFRAADLAPGDPRPYLFLGKVQSREIIESAGYQERMARFASLQPENALADYYLAVTIWNRNHGLDNPEPFTKVRDLLHKAIALDSHLGLAYLQLGIVYAEEHDYSKAIRAYQQAINVSPDLEEAHYRLSETYHSIGEPANAARELKIYKQLSQQTTEKLERQRREIQQFVIALRDQGSPQVAPH